jgi:hypothetical protein
LASLIIGVSLIVASLSWAGFTLSRTVLDPGRSERLADQLLENPDVRQALTSRLADALEAQIPAEVPVPRSVIETGAATALDDPRVEALIRDGFVRVHQNALEGNDEPVVVDANALGAAGRDMLVQVRPELDPFLPQSPALEVELPTTGLTWIGSVKNFVDRFTGIGAIVAFIGAITAFAVARDRAPVLRRVAFWGYAASAFWLLVGYGIPWLAGSLSPTSAAIATAAADVFFGAMIRPAVIMAIAATVLLLAGFIWPVFERRRGARAVQPRRTTAPVVGAAGTNGPAQPIAGAAHVPIQPPLDPTMVQPRVQPIQTQPAQTAPTQTQPAHTQRTYGDPRVANASTIRVNPELQQAPVQQTPPTQPKSVLWESDTPKEDTDQMPIPAWSDEQQTQRF